MGSRIFFEQGVVCPPGGKGVGDVLKREDGADVVNMLLRVRRVDDDVVQDPHAEDVEVLPEDVVHEILEHRWSVGRPLGANSIFKVPLPTPKRCFPFISLTRT